MKIIEMKNMLINGLFVLAMMVGFSSCQEDFDERFQLKEQFVEFEDAVSTTVAVGKTYPILARTLTAANGKVELQINMTGEQFGTDQQLNWKIIPDESTAVENRDFKIASKTVELKANSSKTVLTLEAAPSTGVGSTIVVLELVGNDKIKAMEKYKRVGIRCIY